MDFPRDQLWPLCSKIVVCNSSHHFFFALSYFWLSTTGREMLLKNYVTCHKVRKKKQELVSDAEYLLIFLVLQGIFLFTP